MESEAHAARQQLHEPDDNMLQHLCAYLCILMGMILQNDGLQPVVSLQQLVSAKDGTKLSNMLLEDQVLHK